MHRFHATLLLLTFANTIAAQQPNPREEKVRKDKASHEAAGYWIYNDVPKAFEEAKKSGKPIMAVLRCVPCVECVKLDDEIIDADAALKPLLEQFTRVRIVSTNGLDLSLFQFDTDQSFAVFFLNADGTLYGRFGTRSHRTNWVGDVSVEGLAASMKGALALHKDFAKVKDSLATKRGAKPAFATPELFPTLKDKYKATLDYAGKVVPSCIHCHQIGDAQREMALKTKESLPAELLFPYPHPKTLGLILDPKTMATVSEVVTDSPAAKAGLQKGDRINMLQTEPILSIADVQWVLHRTPAKAANLAVFVVRDGGSAGPLTLRLADDWRQQGDISWRASTWGLRRAALGGVLLNELTDDERKAAQLEGTTMALKVGHVGQFAPHNLAHKAGVAKGDIVLEVNGRKDLARETDVLAMLLTQRTKTVTLKVLRGTETKTITYELPN